MALSPEEAGPPIAVKMSAGAADRLAAACARMQDAAWEATQQSKTRDQYEKAMETYEWISWGATWMLNREARLEFAALPSPSSQQPKEDN